MVLDMMYCSRLGCYCDDCYIRAMMIVSEGSAILMGFPTVT